MEVCQKRVEEGMPKEHPWARRTSTKTRKLLLAWSSNATTLAGRRSAEDESPLEVSEDSSVDEWLPHRIFVFVVIVTVNKRKARDGGGVGRRVERTNKEEKEANRDPDVNKASLQKMSFGAEHHPLPPRLP